MPEETKSRMPARQRTRLALIILSFILYPVTFAYIACPIITEAASQGIVAGGLVVFALLFLSSLVLGRLWCAYFCPTGGLQELWRYVSDRFLRTTRLDWLKYLVFLGIFGGIGYAAWSAGGLGALDLFYRTDHGISITAAGGIAAFLGPVLIVSLFALIFGRRGFCHTFCPIAVMLITGRKIRNLFFWPALHLEAEVDRCIDCKKCSKECPMSLDVNDMVRNGTMEQTECILCGSCVDTCPKNAISYAWTKEITMTPKKILVIMGSPRKGNTFRACEELRGILEQELAVEFEYLWLKDANLLPCKGCYTCIPRGEEKCPNRDDAPLIELKMQEADGVIFASPVYGMNVTGQMKIFVDRFCYIFHRPRFFDKKAFLLTTTGALGIREVLGYMDTVAGVWGFEVAGKAGLIIPPGSTPVPRRITKNRKVLLQAAKEFSAALQMKTRKSPGLMSVIIFHAQRAAFSQMEKVSPCDYQYWKTRGWLSPKARYYVDVPVNPLYGVIGSIFEWIQVRNIRKDLQEAVVP